MNIRIQRVGPQDLQHFLDFFGGAAFEDNPEWSSCYCQFYFSNPKTKDWEKTSGEENRSLAIKQIQTNQNSGHLAYVNDQAIAWCNMAAKKDCPRLDAENSNLKIASIFCFLVAKEFRNQGVARQLLQAACEYLMNEKFEIIEAYPNTQAVRIFDKYHGSLKMYEEAGFKVFKEKPEGRLIVRKKLT